MSTHDVPGANPANHDELAMGCWAEHDDGSLIFVQNTEDGIVYSMFDVSKDPPVEYRGKMTEKGFKKQFTWAKGGGKGGLKEKWTWHDKTPFPWERVMSDFPEGQGFASASGFLTAAARVAESLRLKGAPIRPEDYDHRVTKVVKKAEKLIAKMQDVLKELRP